MVIPSFSAWSWTEAGSRTLHWFNRSHNGATGAPASPEPSALMCGGYLGRWKFKVRRSSSTESSSISLWERCNSFMGAARSFMRANSQIARTPPCEMRFAKSFSDATCTSCCASVSKSIHTIWLLILLWLKSTSPSQRCKQLAPCSSRKELKRTRSQQQYLSMNDSVRGGSKPPIDIFKSQPLPLRRNSKPRLAAFSTRRGVQCSCSPSISSMKPPACSRASNGVDVNRAPSGSSSVGSSSSPD
mmetsp:Transcript_90688/g.235180  ORF Transcript_90688/g.235180 Transcript_90688/m.235180 type:complete len:244 (-) Transcript_90688:1318-2049(-)